jgi:nucleoside-diphosphate-sugar epimerase
MGTMSTILLTGAAGFIGRRVWEMAEGSGHQVLGITRRPVEGRATIIHDLRREFPSLPKADWVFHLAGEYAGADTETLRQADIVMAWRLIDWGRRAGIRNWVFASAAEVYGRCERPATEESPTDPVIPYGRAKLAIERMFQRMSREVPDGRVVILRIGEVYGRQGTLIEELMQRFRSGFCPWFGRGDVPVSFVHVDDVARAFCAAARTAPQGFSVWNVADDEPTTWREFLGFLADLLGTRSQVGLPLPLARLYAAASTAADRVRGRAPTVTQSIVTLLTTPKPQSNRKSRVELGVEYQFPEYRNGLRQLVGPCRY